MNRLSPWLSLFASSGTLVCCALPSLFVALGMGATLAGFISAFPQLIWLSKYKVLVFSLSGFLILFSLFLQYKARNQPCPVDEAQARACTTSRKWSLWISIFSAVVWMVGDFFAFVITRI